MHLLVSNTFRTSCITETRHIFRVTSPSTMRRHTNRLLCFNKSNKNDTNKKKWQLALHCRLRPFVPQLFSTVITRPAPRTQSANAYQISARLGRARLSYSVLSIWLDPFKGTNSRMGMNCTEFGEDISPSFALNNYVLDLGYLVSLQNEDDS